MREEYPRPQFRRGEWLCLNGTWNYATDREGTGAECGLWKADAVLPEQIEVPFCRESVLSGIGDADFCEHVWYQKHVAVNENWMVKGKRVILHIGACDYRAEVWINGKQIGSHVGGYTPFSFDVTDEILNNEMTVSIGVTDDLRSRRQPCGKQSRKRESHGCSYTRVTGIWQTVWLESVPDAYIRSAKYYPDLAAQCLYMELNTVAASGLTVTADAVFEGKPVGHAEAIVGHGGCRLMLPLSELHLWEVGEGKLYDLVLRMGEDTVCSYFGMRSIDVRNGVLLLNGKPVFQRLVLDQGFYPDGIYTAPTDAALENDVICSQKLGFNGARLHQKIFEPRFLYHCDRHGYLVWGEHGDWGLDTSLPEAYPAFIPEWMEALQRDFNHPAIIGWCPLNETQADCSPEFVKLLANLTKSYDPTRLYIESSGWVHMPGLADLLDYHFYEPDPGKMSAKLEPLEKGEEIELNSPYTASVYTGRPSFISEYGGIRWVDDAQKEKSWGYGKDPQSEEEFLERFAGQTRVLMQNSAIGAFCYTQLYDVEQEKNGLYTYERIAKFDAEKFRNILCEKAAVEY